MDDLMLGGQQETVVKDVKLIMKAGQGIGLSLYISKSELVSPLPRVPTTGTHQCTRRSDSSKSLIQCTQCATSVTQFTTGQQFLQIPIPGF